MSPGGSYPLPLPAHCLLYRVQPAAIWTAATAAAVDRRHVQIESLKHRQLAKFVHFNMAKIDGQISRECSANAANFLLSFSPVFHYFSPLLTCPHSLVFASIWGRLFHNLF